MPLGTKTYHEILRPIKPNKTRIDAFPTDSIPEYQEEVAEWLRIEWHEPRSTNGLESNGDGKVKELKDVNTGWYLSFLKYSNELSKLEHHHAIKLGQPVPFKAYEIDNSGTHYLFKGD